MIFGFSEKELEDKKAIFTAQEIAQQPETWVKTIRQIKSIWAELQSFIEKVTCANDYNVILTGAGTSEYVGNSLQPALMQKLDGLFSIGTTDIVATPEAFISKAKPTLLVSFARSGNSPESIGAVKAAERVSDNVRHLFITCNKDGALAKMADEKDNCFSIVLTAETHDRSFAMTSSFTNMYIAALLALSGEKDMKFDSIIAAAEDLVVEGYKEHLDFIKSRDFSRIVYLGSDVLKGIAQESALKMLELTAGKVVALFDTPMGFRHGPKSVINDDTVTLVYLSENKWTRQYEDDVLTELERDKKGSTVLPVVIKQTDGCNENYQLAPLYVMTAQLIALFCSMKLGITPDNPCPTGEVNRVVKGVRIYEE